VCEGGRDYFWRGGQVGLDVEGAALLLVVSKSREIEPVRQLGGKGRVIVAVARFPKKGKRKSKLSFGGAGEWKQPCPVRDPLELVDHDPFAGPEPTATSRSRRTMATISFSNKREGVGAGVSSMEGTEVDFPRIRRI
jgi:hypothetical protein